MDRPGRSVSRGCVGYQPVANSRRPLSSSIGGTDRPSQTKQKLILTHEIALGHNRLPSRSVGEPELGWRLACRKVGQRAAFTRRRRVRYNHGTRQRTDRHSGPGHSRGQYDQAYLADTPPLSPAQEVCHDDPGDVIPPAEDGVCLRASIDDGAGAEPSGEHRTAVCLEGQGNLAGMASNQYAASWTGIGNLGATSSGRDDFKKLIAEVSLGEVGAVFALEASRLARSNADWHR